ncbi:MAG: hypothetical protein R3Y07_09375 [Eubacteriales bacterium]
MKKLNLKKVNLWLNLGLAVLLVIGYLINVPNLNPIYADGAFIWLVVISAFLAVNSPSALAGIKFYQSETGRVQMSVDTKTKSFQKLVLSLVLVWALFFLFLFISSPLFNYKAYRDQIGPLVVSEFSEEIQFVDLSQVPIVDAALAYSLADKKLGENPGMGSQVFLGTPVIQQVAGELVWVVPLQHSGFFKWFQNIEGAAGYIKVSATNLQDITFVPSLIKYQPNSFFFDDITRYLRVVKGYVFDGITDYSFEINDEGEPYWIITTYSNDWIFALPEANGVITLNATTGDTERYSIDTVPSWVDRVQPERFIYDQLNNQGTFVHGIFNFSNRDKFMTSDQETIIYNEGNCYLFTGLTSVGADESAIGFVMVDMVTKEPQLYQISGTTENKAMESAEGEVQQFGYRATSPIFLNHNGIPTYFITLKDNGGLIKQYAFVSVTDVTTVGAGESINAALRDYNNKIGASSSFNAGGDSVDTLSGTVLRISGESSSGGVTYKFILEEHDTIMFSIDAESSPELALTEKGDRVTVSFYETESTVITAQAFDNLALNIQ